MKSSLEATEGALAAIFHDWNGFIKETKQECCSKHGEYTSKMFYIEGVTAYWSACIECHADWLYDPTPQQLRERQKEDEAYRAEKGKVQEVIAMTREGNSFSL